MATWPTTLPAVSLSGYSIEPVDQSVRTDMEVGSARARRRTAARLDIVSVSWLFTDAQMAIFRAWFEDGATGAAGGAGWFTIGLPMGDGGVVSSDARFVGVPKPSLLSGKNWRVSASLEVR